MSDDKNARYRFSVPLADEKVNKWIEAQNNLGFSLRTLIKAAISNWGNQDVTCIELGSEVKKRGRPPKIASQYSDHDSQVDLFGTANAEESETGTMPEEIPKEEKPTVQPINKVEAVNAAEGEDEFVDPENLFNN